MKNQPRNEAFIIGKLIAEGFPISVSKIRKVLKLNPTSPLERAMRTKSMKEVEKLVKELKEREDAFFDGLGGRDYDNPTEEETPLIERVMMADLRSDPKALLKLVQAQENDENE